MKETEKYFSQIATALGQTKSSRAIRLLDILLKDNRNEIQKAAAKADWVI